jgi:streptomycin 6-kinase
MGDAADEHITISAALRRRCDSVPGGASWLAKLPASLNELMAHWELTLGGPLGGEEGSCSWVYAVTRRDGLKAVLKLGLPHLEAEQEGDGLMFWDGDPVVHVFERDVALGGLLLERCVPGTPLRAQPESDQDRIIAGLLRRLWRSPPVRAFRPLSEMLEYWGARTRARQPSGTDGGLVQQGLRLLEELSASAPVQVLLATDLHAGNILRAQRQEWLVIDPKPFVGDPAYDATQHLLNCSERLRTDAERTIRGFADLLEVDHERVRLWTFARLAAESHAGGGWGDVASLARALAP